MSAFTEEWVHGPSETNFYTRTYTPSSGIKAVLVFVHGFIEHIGRYEHIFPSYAEAGIAVFAFDQRGYGRTALESGPHGAERAARKEGYGKTSSDQQREDIYWAISHAGETLASWSGNGSVIPVYLMGHSMGGALVLSFGSSPPKPLSHPLAGIIATSPLIAQAHPVASLVRKAGGLASNFLPWATVKAAVNPAAGTPSYHLSHDQKVGEDYQKDPYVQFFSTLRAVSTMLNLGSHLSSQGFTSWPASLPVLLIHGTADEVTSYTATEEFYRGIKADDKSFSSYEGGFHELHNEPEFRQQLIDEVIGWTLKHAMSNSQSGAKL